MLSITDSFKIVIKQEWIEIGWRFLKTQAQHLKTANNMNIKFFLFYHRKTT